MTADPKGRGLFIVDNSVSGWTGLRYLEEWSGIANSRRMHEEEPGAQAPSRQQVSLDTYRIPSGTDGLFFDASRPVEFPGRSNCGFPSI